MHIFMNTLAIVSAYLLDLIFGDPERAPHPVRGIGMLVSFLDRRLRRGTRKLAERVKGAMLTVAVIGITVSLAYLLLRVSSALNPLLGHLVWIYLAYTTLSVKNLHVEAKAVLKKINAGPLPEARSQLSRIVGRDTRNLSEKEITQAAVESIAENTTDGIIAPLFYLIIGGPALALAYKAVNTLDSMVGYKNERYVNIGWFAAKLDDVMNFIPARITGVLIPAASFVAGKDFKASFRIMREDGKKHPSPNSGISEAAMAGALGIRLGGLPEKPFLGEGKKAISPSCINEAVKISLIVSFLGPLIGVLLKWAIV